MIRALVSSGGLAGTVDDRGAFHHFQRGSLTGAVTLIAGREILLHAIGIAPRLSYFG